jgi:hypothetical protein
MEINSRLKYYLYRTLWRTITLLLLVGQLRQKTRKLFSEDLISFKGSQFN